MVFNRQGQEVIAGSDDDPPEWVTEDDLDSFPEPTEEPEGDEIEGIPSDNGDD